jgi:hypothetical protein
VHSYVDSSPNTVRHSVRTIVVFAVAVLLRTASAFAQPPDPIGPYVVDARIPLARFKDDATIASAISVEPDNLPTRGLGLALGAHVYPIRKFGIALGIGGEMVWARGSRTGEQDEDETEVPPTVTTRLSAISPQLSLNFGTGEGWSYISGGMGWARLTAERDDQTWTDGGGRARMTHYGAGARWFTGPHLAFTFDLRFYTINALAASGTRPAFPRNRLMVISAGVSVK